MKSYPYSKLKEHFLKDPAVKRAYDDLEPEFKVISLMIEQRLKNGLTQAELAKKVGTKQSAIARFETGRYNPSLEFLRKIARALGAELVVKVRT